MPFEIHVNIWGWRGIGVEWGRVGHVMLSDPTSNTALLSQFPHQLGEPSVPKGPNVFLNYSETFAAEGGPPDVVFSITIADQYIAPFQSARLDHLTRPVWDWDPAPPTETHCARSAYDALRAARMPIDPLDEYVIGQGERREILPNTLWHLLTQIGKVPIAQTGANLAVDDILAKESAVAFARSSTRVDPSISDIA